MKHLLNEMSDEEKSYIRGKYIGGKNIDTTKFRKLMESKLGDAKPFLSEQGIDSYPSMDDEPTTTTTTTSNTDVPECDSKMMSSSDAPGSDMFVDLSGKSVVIRTNPTVSPGSVRYTVFVDNKPFCQIPRR